MQQPVLQIGLLCKCQLLCLFEDLAVMLRTRQLQQCTRMKSQHNLNTESYGIKAGTTGTGTSARAGRRERERLEAYDNDAVSMLGNRLA